MIRHRIAALFRGQHAVDGALFWIMAGFLVLLKLALTSDLAVQMIYSPHDDGLYVSRAYHLLLGEAFGPYDARLLVKVPGISLWLAANRTLGIPYLLSINLFYIVAGIYFIAALRRTGYDNKALLLGVFVLYLFNPVTLDHQWFRVMREPLSIILLVFLLGAMVFILSDIRDRRIPFTHIFISSVVFAFALLVREEDRLLYGLLIFFYAVLFWTAKRHRDPRTNAWWVGIAFTIALPIIAANTADAMMRFYVAKHYGAPVVYDFGDGEFPRLIAAMRSVESKKDNRHVMITQEALGKLREAAPRLVPVIDRLPKPGPDSYSCQRFRVCSEWTNGWMLFWIKDAAYQAGLTPDSVTAQTYFRDARIDIEQACTQGQLSCRDKGQGLLPRFELRWTRAYVYEAIGVVKMMFMPGIGLAGKPPLIYPVDVDYGRIYQAVTMTPYYDSALQMGNQADAWKNYSQDLNLSLKYWLRYPDVASTRDFGPNAGGDKLGALIHYQRHGQYEGRIWEEKKKITEDSPYHYRNPLAAWRPIILKLFEKGGLALEFLGVFALVARLMMSGRAPLGPFLWVASSFFAFTLLRVAALSYVSVYMGAVDVRLFFSTYVVLLLFAPLLVFDAARTFRSAGYGRLINKKRRTRL